MPKKIQQQCSVSFEYPVYFTRSLFETTNKVLASALQREDSARPTRCMVFVDRGVLQERRHLLVDIDRYLKAHSIERVGAHIILSGGEAVKNDFTHVMHLANTLLEHELCRHSYVLAIGGGALLDAVGFAASIVHRGLRTVRIPTTVLAQNDAGVGVKTAINLHGGKNTIGTFAPPAAVINDADFLETLPDREWIAGIAEAFKVAILKDADFFDFLGKNAAALRARDAELMQQLIERCASAHLDHIRQSGDAFESGNARPLDFGHWSAHKLESMSSYRIGHGQAVGVGIALDACYAVQAGLLESEAFLSIVRGLTQSGLCLWFDELEQRLGDGELAILQGLRDFQIHLGGRLSIPLPTRIGEATEVNEMDPHLIEISIATLKSLARLPSREVEPTRSSSG